MLVHRTLFSISLFACLAAGGGFSHPARNGWSHAMGAEQAVQPSAFRGQGLLAFVSHARLFVLDGTRGTVRQLPIPGNVSHPAWSPDGRWLAAIRQPPKPAGGHLLWLVRADGSDAHPISSLQGRVTAFSWSPVTNAVAAVTAGRDGIPHSLSLVRPGAKLRDLVRNKQWLGDPLWSADGRSLAYVATLPYRNAQARSDAMYTISVSGGAPIRRFVYGEGISLAGWWPDGKGLLFWLDPQHSASIAAEGLNLYTQSLLGGPARSIEETLLYPDWLAWSPAHRSLLFVEGGGRPAWNRKTLYIADTQHWRAAALHRVRGIVQLDPAWSPDGTQIAFVQARDRGGNLAGGLPWLRRWYRTQTLWVMDAQGGGAHRLARAGGGVFSPIWSRDGAHIVYVRKRAIWLFDLRRGVTTRVAQLDRRADVWPGDQYGDYYGHTAWSDFLAWYR